MCPNFSLSELPTKLDDVSDIMGIRLSAAFEVSLVLLSALDDVSDVAGFFPEAASGELSSLCFLVPILIAGVPRCLCSFLSRQHCSFQDSPISLAPLSRECLDHSPTVDAKLLWSYVKNGKRGACRQKAATVLPNRTAAT